MELRETLERGIAFAEACVDHGGGVIQNVALLGAASLNNRVYTRQAMADAAKLYSGVPVYVNHPTESEMLDRGGVRSVLDLAGRVLNPRLVGTQVRGDIQVLEREPTKSLFLAIAEQMPGIAGMSHRASGSTHMDESGTEVVDSIDHVFAVELVTEPATVAGLFESITKGKTMRRVTPDTIVEARDRLLHGPPVFGAGRLAAIDLREVHGPKWDGRGGSKPVTAEAILEASHRLIL